MRILSGALVVVILSTVFIAGCSDDEVAKDMKPTDTTPFKGMLDDQSKNLKGGSKTAVPKP